MKNKYLQKLTEMCYVEVYETMLDHLRNKVSNSLLDSLLANLVRVSLTLTTVKPLEHQLKSLSPSDFEDLVRIGPVAQLPLVSYEVRSRNRNITWKVLVDSHTNPHDIVVAEHDLSGNADYFDIFGAIRASAPDPKILPRVDSEIKKAASIVSKCVPTWYDNDEAKTCLVEFITRTSSLDQSVGWWHVQVQRYITQQKNDERFGASQL